jgi:hypothetical protein
LAIHPKFSALRYLSIVRRYEQSHAISFKKYSVTPGPELDSEADGAILQNVFLRMQSEIRILTVLDGKFHHQNLK